VEIRVAGDDVDLAYVVDERVPGGDADGDLSARITLRLSEGLKSRVEERASGEGVSVNAFIVRTLERGTSSRGTGVGTRLRGYDTT
jgi:predicted HicB family RNase H-like nuclease